MMVIKANTTVPIPHLLAYDSSAENSLGFEWILLEKAGGISLEEAWGSISWEEKEAMSKAVAEMMMSLQSTFFNRIGSLYCTNNIESDSILDQTPQESDVAERPPADRPSSVGKKQFSVGRIVERSFFTGKRIFLKTDRGPYSSLQDFILASIDMEIASLSHLLSDEPIREDLTAMDTSIKENFEDEEEPNLAIAETITSLQTLRASRPWTRGLTSKKFILSHPDLSAKNILVSPVTHKITTLLDWEFTPTRPPWQATTYPLFLQDQECELPDLANTGIEAFNERKHLYEKTQLRKLYNRQFLLADLPTPESYNRDKGVRRMRKLMEIIADVEECGKGAIDDFLGHEEDDGYVTHKRWMPGVFVAEWEEAYVASDEEVKGNKELLEAYRLAAEEVSRRELEEEEGAD